MILTVDLGTSLTKVGLWSEDGLAGLASAPVAVTSPDPDRAEQDPDGWVRSVVGATTELLATRDGPAPTVDAVGLTGARQTFAVFDPDGTALGPGIVWSDRRAGPEARILADATGGLGAAGTGIPVDGASLAAKLAWVRANHPDRLAPGRWLLGPRDRVSWWLTGQVATDRVMASRSGLYDADGGLVTGLAGEAASLLPPVAEAGRVAGTVGPCPADVLGIRAGTPVVLCGGDRAAEVVGAGATAARPMVSWGTTANVSVPAPTRPVELRAGMVATRALDGGWLVEGGLSAAGSFLGWLARTTGRSAPELAELARTSEIGARGVVAVPWLDGARAPWWRSDAGAGFAGVSSATDAGDLARSVFESVASEVARCLALVVAGPDRAPLPLGGLALGGGGATTPVWQQALAGITGLTLTCRRSAQAASAGAALTAAAAVGLGWDLDRLDPVVATIDPDPVAVARYAELAARADRVASALVGLGGPGPVDPGPGRRAGS